jgi:putative ABC transport system permease protein
VNWKIIFAGLKARPVRTGVTILAVSLQVTLILVLVGLTTGTTDEVGRRVAGIGGDILFQPAGSDVILALDPATMVPEIGPKLKEFKEIQEVSPLLVKFNTKNFTNIFGIDPPSFDAVSGGLRYLKGQLFSGPDEIVIDDIFAKDKKLGVGDTYELEHRTFKITGIVENGKGARVVMALKTAQELANAGDKVTLFLIKLKDASDIDGTIEKLKNDIPGYELRNLPEYAKLMNGANIPGLDAVNEVIVFVALCIGVLVIFLSMYTTIMERTREIGILRSLGASKVFIVTLIMKEALLICLVGILLGMAGSFVISHMARAYFPTLVFLISNKWKFVAALSALMSGVIGSLHPALKASGQDPVEAFAYE